MDTGEALARSLDEFVGVALARSVSLTRSGFRQSDYRIVLNAQDVERLTRGEKHGSLFSSQKILPLYG